MPKDSNIQQRLALFADTGQMSETLGLLIGAIAHDFRNHLTVVQCWGDVLMRPGAINDKAVGYVQRILGAADRAIHLTEQLLAFSNQQQAILAVVSLGEVIGDVVKLAEGVIDENVHLHCNDCSDLGKVSLDYARFQQALLTAILNARDAMPQGGEIFVKCSHVSVDEAARAKLAGVATGENILVADTSVQSGPRQETTFKMYLPRALGQD